MIPKTSHNSKYRCPKLPTGTKFNVHNRSTFKLFLASSFNLFYDTIIRQKNDLCAVKVLQNVESKRFFSLVLTNCTQTAQIHLLIDIFFAVTIMVAYNKPSTDQTKTNNPSSISQHFPCSDSRGMQTNAHSCQKRVGDIDSRPVVNLSWAGWVIERLISKDAIPVSFPVTVLIHCVKFNKNHAKKMNIMI